MENTMVGMKELMEYLGIRSRVTIHKYIDLGMPHERGKNVKNVDKLFFDLKAVTEWMERGCQD